VSEGILWSDMVKEFGGGFEPLPNGDYDVFVESAEYKVAGTGKDMIKVKFKVQGGPFNGRTVYWNAVFSPRTADGSVNEGALRAWFGNMGCFGLKAAFFAANPSMDLIAASMTGKKVIVTLATREWQGQEQNDVKRVKPPQGGAIEVTPSGTTPIFGSTPTPTAASSTLPPVSAAEEDEDDAPF
jgi:uncharacterized protein DUF669